MRDRRERHHILFNRRVWSSTDDLAELRGDPRLIVPLDHDTHQELHENVSHVPPLSLHVARASLRLFEDFESNGDYMKSVEHLQTSIEQAIRHPKSDRIEREVGSLAVYALDLQKPYIETSRRSYPTNRARRR